ncbi:MAG: hypothetical protein RLZZ618_1774 [Pseudomonadota bacterium]|jgi:hypothetical protein
MRGIIHISKKSSSSHKLIALCVAAPLALFVWRQLLTTDNPTPRLESSQAATSPSPAADLFFSKAGTPTVGSVGPGVGTRAGTTRPPASPADAPTTDTSDDFATRNAGIEVNRLTLSRPVSARSFLNEVVLTPSPKGGFVVTEVLPDSSYERMGVRPGDVIYSLDSPTMKPVDESSMVALIGQSELELEVYRNGLATRLHLNLASPPEEARADDR